MEVYLGVVFSAGLIVLLVYLGWRERRVHRDEIAFFKAAGWDEVYRFPKHYWWHRETNRAIIFGDYYKDESAVIRLVERANPVKKKRKR